MKALYHVPKIGLTAILLGIIVSISYAQDVELFRMQEGHTLAAGQIPFDSTLQFMDVDLTLMHQLSAGIPDFSHFILPIKSKRYTIRMHRYSLSDVEVKRWDGEMSRPVEVRPTPLYTGEVEGEPGSMVYTYSSGGALYGSVHLSRKGSFDFGPAPGDKTGKKYVLISKVKAHHGRGFTCSAIDDLYYRDRAAIESRIVRTTCKKVRFSIHADYDLYVKLGYDIQRVVDYVKGVFHGASQIYRKEGIHVQLSEIVVHTVEDDLPHTSANDDLWAFKRVFKTYNGDLVMLLSGYTDSQGHPSLGGVAFTNSLCIKSYSYAYGNVEIDPKAYPVYSWDVHVFTHEIGHILGSPHTHECVWGPFHNEPIDGCYPSSNGCPAGPIPTKGTIMSYCHLPGRPGIDFTLGFGEEPGNKIRAKVESSSCLSEYIPGAAIPVAVGVYHANIECTDGTTIHYYYDNNTVDESDDLWLLSIDTRGEDIGHVGDPGFEVKVEVVKSSYEPTDITAQYVPDGKVFHVINRYWFVGTSMQPNSPVEVQFPYEPEDFDGLDAALGGVDIQQLEAYKIEQPGTPNPRLNHAGADTSNYFQYTYANTPSMSTWSNSVTPDGFYLASYELDHFSGGGLGVYTQSALAITLNSFFVYNHDPEVILEWVIGDGSTSLRFDIQRSTDGVHFEHIGQVDARNDQSGINTYHFIDKNPASGTSYYRLKMVDSDKSYTYSTIRTIHRSANDRDAELIVAPNPVTGSMAQLVLRDVPLPATLMVFNALGLKVMEQRIVADRTAIHLYYLPSGMYWLELRSNGQLLRKNIVIR